MHCFESNKDIVILYISRSLFDNHKNKFSKPYFNLGYPRFLDLRSMCEQLESENYHAKDAVLAREQQIMDRWEELLELLKKHKEKLERSSSILNLTMEIDTLILTIKQLQKEMSSDVGVLHLLDVQEKLQKFHLQESQVNCFYCMSKNS